MKSDRSMVHFVLERHWGFKEKYYSISLHFVEIFWPMLIVNIRFTTFRIGWVYKGQDYGK
jgi:hypothetical protein